MQEEIKFGVLIPKELNDKINGLVPYGLKSQLFRIMLTRMEYELRVGGDAALTQWLHWTPPEVNRG